MTDVPSAAKTLAELTVGIPGAGRRTLLDAMPALAGARLPENFRLCVLDAERPEAPAQLALLDELAADPGLEPRFVLNKADKVPELRAAVTRTLALLRERGFAEPGIYPICAAAAKLFRLPVNAELSPRHLAAREAFYERFGPGENSLSAYAVTGEPALELGGREISPEQLSLALTNTGIPALAAALAALRMPDEATGNRQQATEDGENEATGNRQQATGDGENEATGNRQQATEDGENEATGNRQQAAGDGENEATDNRQQAAGDEENEAVGAAIGRPPEAEPSEEPSSSHPLTEMLAQAETADCARLLELARAISTAEAPVEERDLALDVLHEAYLNRQIQELDALTRGAEGLDLSGLRALADRIAAGPYTVQARTPYAARINSRIDALQYAALDALCTGVEEAEASDLAGIRAALDRADCAEVLKTAYYRRIEDRQDALDLAALDRATAGAESMSEQELRAVAETLEGDDWSPKFVTAYRHKIALLREAALYREVEAELDDLDDMERTEILAVRERIEARELPPRFTVPAMKRLNEKLFRLDMLRLMALNRDFDRLDFEDIDELRFAVNSGDYCDKAKRHYLRCVLARENALILENCSARAELTKQLIAHHKLHSGDFVLPSSGEYYREKLAEFWDGSGLETPRDIPVFLFECGSMYAMTATRFYYKVGKHLDYLPLENIERFQAMKQHLSLVLQIVGKDNSYRLTEARISRSGYERSLEFLNDCLSRWAEPGPAAPLPAALRVRMAEDVQSCTAPVEPELLSPKMAWEIFCRACETAGLREGNLIRLEDRSAMERLPKLRLSLGLPENTPVIWYKSASRLGPVKEGVALGARGIYLKEGKLPLKTIPMEEIASVQAVGSKRTAVTTLQNETIQLEVSDDMAPLIADYARAVQLSAYLFSREEKA